MKTIYGQTQRDFERAHTRAFVRSVLALLMGRVDQTKLLSYDEVKEKIRWNEESYIGMREVPVSAIVGSVGRYRDFDRAFLPRQRGSKERWKRVDEAYYEDVPLPPVQLYKIGDVYFVRDCNHRVSVARDRGVEFIDAEVIECHTSVPLSSDITAEDLQAIGEYAEFLEWSRLDQLRPQQNIHFTVPGGYTQLREHISVHEYYLGLERGTPISLHEAVTSWYDNVYCPVVSVIRDEHILDKFRSRTEADLYLWIMDHLYFLKERYADGVGASHAAADFAEHYARPSFFEAIRRRIALFGGSSSSVEAPALPEKAGEKQDDG